MIRLAVHGEEPSWYSVRFPLRGATLAFGQKNLDTASLATFDAVLFLEPEHFSVADVERVVQSQKPVLVAGTACRSQQDFSELAKLPDLAVAEVAVLNPVHYLPSRKLIRHRLDSGQLGIPGLVRLHRWEPAVAVVEQPPGALPIRLFCDLEFVLSLFREVPNAVYAVNLPSNEQASSSGRLIQIHLGFPGGGMALIDYTNRLPPGDDYVSLNVIGSHGAAYADDHHNMQLVYRGGHPQSLRVDETSDQWTTMVQEFVDGMQVNRDFRAGLLAWTNAVQVADAVLTSLDRHRAVSTPSSHESLPGQANPF